LVNDEYNLDKEVTALFNNAKEKIRVVENDSVRQKKQIVIELAKSLEGRIATDTICIGIKNQLRGTGVSDRHIEECLEEKYKQAHRVKNALKRNKSKSESIQQTENLAALPRLDQEDDLMEKDEEQNEMNKRYQESTIRNSDGQILILNDNERDQDVDSDLSKMPSANANTKVPMKEIFSDELSTITPHQEEEKEEDQLSVSSNRTGGSTPCSQCIKENVHNFELKNENTELKLINFELAEVIKEFDQFQTADKLPRSSQDNNEVSKDSVTTREDIAEFEEYKTFIEVSEYAKPFFKLGNSAKIPFSIKIDIAKRKLISLHLGKLE
jgi:hypothetical protein